MKVCAPHMGTLYVALRALFGGLGTEIAVPPACSRKTLSLGTKYSPEFVCLPYKMMLGNFVEGLELGADTLVMIEGERICRLGYYMRVMEHALRDLGYDFQVVTTRVFQREITALPDALRVFNPDASLRQILSAVRLALAKLNVLDAVERKVQEVRSRELGKGDADRAWQDAIDGIDDAHSVREAKATRDDALRRLAAIPQDGDFEPIRVGIIGEIYALLEPFANMDVERELGHLGVWVHRTVMLSDWTRGSLFLNALGMGQHDRAHKAARPYLNRDVGGDGWESVGETVLHARGGYDGMVHLAPFTCMPEVIAQNIMVSMKRDVDIPVMAITCDEQMGRAGMITRLEAFVDLLGRRKRASARSSPPAPRQLAVAKGDVSVGKGSARSAGGGYGRLPGD